MYFFNLIFALEQFKRNTKFKGIVNICNETTKDNKILCIEHLCSKKYFKLFPLKFEKLLELEFDRFLKLEILFQQNCNQEIFKNYNDIFGSVEQLLYENTAILLKKLLDDLYSSLVNVSKLEDSQNNAISKNFCCVVWEQKIKNLFKDKDSNIHRIINQLVISNEDIKILKIYSGILKYLLFQIKYIIKKKKN
ncbi:hypothetical protein GVAV_000249 [Gurleya vavrai]